MVSTKGGDQRELGPAFVPRALGARQLCFLLSRCSLLSLALCPQALKRKATAAKAEPAPKRSSRPSKEDKPKKKSTAASSSSSKGKSKASKVITIDDSSDEEDQQDSDDDVMVVEDKPAASSSKSKGKVKKDKGVFSSSGRADCRQ